MKPSAFRLVTRLCALILGAASPLNAQTQLASAVRSTTLENGLQVIVVQNPTIPFVTLQMVFRAGSFTQTTAAEEGLPHLIEHMLFRRGDTRGDAFDEEASKIQASWNGTTNTESVQYYLTFPSTHLENGMELISNLIRKPTFSKQVLEAERPIVRGELERRASEPQGLLRTSSDMILWEGDGWRGKNPGGNILSLNAATPERLSDLYKRYYVPNNAALVVVGDVKDTVVFNLANKIFRGWKRGPDPLASLPPSPIAPLTGIKRKIITGDVKDVTVLVRWHGPSVGKDRAATYAADVFAGLVNQPLSGTQRRLVDGGLVESVAFRYLTLNHVGPIELMARTSADRAVAAIEALGAELKRLVQPDYFAADDLVLAKKLQHVSALFRLESGAATADMLAEFWGSAGLDYYVGYEKNLEAQTRDDIRRFVATYLAAKPMVVNVLVSADAWNQVGTGMQRALGAWTVP